MSSFHFIFQVSQEKTQFAGLFFFFGHVYSFPGLLLKNNIIKEAFSLGFPCPGNFIRTAAVLT